jgi:hypothetical protein
MATIGKHPAVIRMDVRFGLFGRARLELAPIGLALVGPRTGTAYTWSEVKEVQYNRGRLVIKTEADREKLVKTKESTTLKPYVEKLTRALVVSIEGATEPGLADSQVRRFLILHKELDPDDDELTRTRKVRRGFIADKYASLVDAMYAGRTVQHVDTAVKFEDGRSGVVSADLRIEDARVLPPQPAKAA